MSVIDVWSIYYGRQGSIKYCNKRSSATRTFGGIFMIHLVCFEEGAFCIKQWLAVSAWLMTVTAFERIGIERYSMPNPKKAILSFLEFGMPIVKYWSKAILNSRLSRRTHHHQGIMSLDTNKRCGPEGYLQYRRQELDVRQKLRPFIIITLLTRWANHCLSSTLRGVFCRNILPLGIVVRHLIAAWSAIVALSTVKAWVLGEGSLHYCRKQHLLLYPLHRLTLSLTSSFNIWEFRIIASVLRNPSYSVRYWLDRTLVVTTL